jgi:hypothetical protein
LGSVQVPWVMPLVYPGPVVIPAALSQRPEYRVQLTPLAVSSSPMFGVQHRQPLRRGGRG